MSSILVVSPHRDDAAFSCAIAIRVLARQHTVILLNCFTQSEYAPFGTNSALAVSDLRLQEDQQFAALSGVLLDDLNLVDAPQRLSINLSDISTERALNAEDFAPRDTIAASIIRHRPDLILLPLALGNHIDHRIAQSAALQTQSTQLAFYEDLPYAARISSGTAEHRAYEISPQLTPWIFRDHDGSPWKARCAALYPSQINSATVEEIADYSNRYSQGERFWVTASGAKWLHEVSTN